MEKRLLLAFILSFFVLSVWTKINPPPQPMKQRTAENIQVSENNIVKENLFEDHQQKQPPKTESQALPSPVEKINILDNGKLEVVFSNIGGTIKSIRIRDYDISLPLTDFNKLNFDNSLAYNILNISDSYISYSLEIDGRKIIKKYTLEPSEYLINNSINIIDKKMSKGEDGFIRGFSLDISRLDKDIQKSREKTLLEYSIATENNTIRKANAYKLGQKDILESGDKIKWVGFRDRYFCAIYKPLFKNTGFHNKINNKKLNININNKLELNPNQPVSFNSVLYFGPQDLKILSSYPYDFKEIMKFSNYSLLDGIAKIVYKFLHLLHGIIPVWGICIILMAITIYLVMYPLSIKGMKSMKKIQSLQPEIAQIRERNKNNPQKLQKETMELYKENSVNPFGGCLPLFLQMPFFIGVYQVLWRSVAFKNSKFLWINDLSQPDHLLKFPASLPFVGEYLNILPILMIIIMIIQQKFSAKNMVVADPAQEASQKMMMSLFPLMIGVVFYNIASGLALYFTTFYLLSGFTQWKISKMTF